MIMSEKCRNKNSNISINHHNKKKVQQQQQQQQIVHNGILDLTLWASKSRESSPCVPPTRDNLQKQK